MISIALTGLEKNVSLYVGDIIFFACSSQYHNDNLRHLITENGVLTDPSKNESIKNYIIPKDEDDVRHLIVFCNYYGRLIQNFA